MGTWMSPGGSKAQAGLETCTFRQVYAHSGLLFGQKDNQAYRGNSTEYSSICKPAHGYLPPDRTVGFQK